ncbi:MAG: hypothetical protein KHY36_03590, partial [Subdoligranulum variabile]|nr:hypothetical protein [Subdoligranulum variabile]
MKKHLIAVLLTACLLFSFGTTAFADSSGGQESTQADNGATGWFGYYLSNENATWGTNDWENKLQSYEDEKTHKTKYKELNHPGMSANPIITGNLLIHTFHCQIQPHSWKRFWD